MAEHHVPVVGGVGAVELTVGRAVQVTSIVHRIVRSAKRVGGIIIHDTAIAVVGVVQIGDAVVVVVPVDAVLKAVAVNV